MVETPYFASQFFERPNAVNLLQSRKDSGSGSYEAKFLQLIMDSPKVDWLVLNKLDDILSANGREKTL